MLMRKWDRRHSLRLSLPLSSTSAKLVMIELIYSQYDHIWINSTMCELTRNENTSNALLVTWTNKWWSQFWRNASPKLSDGLFRRGPGHGHVYGHMFKLWNFDGIHWCSFFIQTVPFVLNLKSCNISWMKEVCPYKSPFCQPISACQAPPITFYDLSFLTPGFFRSHIHQKAPWGQKLEYVSR